MCNLENQREKEYNFVVMEVFRLKKPMKVICDKYNVNYSSFLYWLSKYENLKYEMKIVIEKESKEKLNRTINLIIEKELYLNDACIITGVSIYTLQKYLKTIDKDKRKTIKTITDKKRTEKVRTTNLKKEKNKNIKTVSNLLESIKSLSNNNIIYADKMLDFLIEKNVSTPRIYFTNKLEKMGYKIIEY